MYKEISLLAKQVVSPTIIFKADKPVKLVCGLSKCYTHNPLGCFVFFFNIEFLHQNQKSDTLAKQQSRFDSSHKRAAMSVSPVFGNPIAAFCF